MPTQNKKQIPTKPRIPPLVIENAKLIYKNFSGRAKRFNSEGLRNFHVVLDPDQAKRLEVDGWNVKWPKPRDDGEERNPTLKVKVRFDNYPPLVKMLTKRNTVELDEETIGLLDTAEIESVDLRITGSYNQLETGWSGFTAYLNQMFVTIAEHDLVAKHSGHFAARYRDDD